MPDPITDTPVSPPAAPVIPVGLATITGYLFGLISAVCAAVLVVLEGLPDDASTAVVVATLIGTAAAAVVRVNDGRQKQAAAALATTPRLALASGVVGELREVPDDEIDPELNAEIVNDVLTLPPDEGDQAAHANPEVPSA